MSTASCTYRAYVRGVRHGLREAGEAGESGAGLGRVHGSRQLDLSLMIVTTKCNEQVDGVLVGGDGRTAADVS